jgi:hypothetical protein
MKTRKKPKHQHRVEEFSESEDEVFEQDLANLGDKAEQALKERQQNGLNNGDSTEPKNIPEDEQFDDEDLNTSELSSLEDDELKLLGEVEDEDVDMGYLNKAIQEENDDPMDTQEAANKGNQDKNNSISAPTKKKTKAAPRTSMLQQIIRPVGIDSLEKSSNCHSLQLPQTLFSKPS